jgi:acetyl-CoA carboxylase alpha subunit
VLTADDIRRVRIFADLEGPACERLSRAAADISLTTGDYAAHEGDDPALIGLLEGRIGVVKVVDGIERLVGERRPGDVIGEVPITFGSPYPVGFRAAESSPRDANRAARLPCGRFDRTHGRSGSRTACERPDLGAARAAGRRGRAASTSGRRRRTSV